MPIMLVTALRQTDHRIQAVDAGVDAFISKPFNGHELRARVRSLIRLKRYTDELDTAEAVILSLALTIEARDSCTDRHCQRLAGYASQLGRQEHPGIGDRLCGELRSLRRVRPIVRHITSVSTVAATRTVYGVKRR